MKKLTGASAEAVTLMKGEADGRDMESKRREGTRKKGEK